MAVFICNGELCFASFLFSFVGVKVLRRQRLKVHFPCRRMFCALENNPGTSEGFAGERFISALETVASLHEMSDSHLDPRDQSEKKNVQKKPPSDAVRCSSVL